MIPWNLIIGESSVNIKNIPFEIYAFDNDNEAKKGCYLLSAEDEKIERTILSLHYS